MYKKIFFIFIVLLIAYYFLIQYLAFGFYMKGRDYGTSMYYKKNYPKEDKDGKLTLVITHYFPLVNLNNMRMLVKDIDGKVYYCGKYKKKIRLKKYPEDLTIYLLKGKYTYIFGGEDINYVSGIKDPYENIEEFELIRQNKIDNVTLKVILLPWEENYSHYRIKRIK